MTLRCIFTIVITINIALAVASSAFAGKIVVANDEWHLSNDGFIDPSDGGDFALSIAAWFHPGGSGNFLVYSDNFGLTQAQLETTMTGAGHGWTVDTAETFDVSTLLTYDGVFLGGFPADNGILIDYVNSGGNVYLCGGSGLTGHFRDAPTEASAWNTFLNAFGLEFESVYNPVTGHIPIASGHPIFTDVDHLYHVTGQDIIDIDPDDPDGYIVFPEGESGLFAVYEHDDPTANERIT